jgi:hypothetical protein
MPNTGVFSAHDAEQVNVAAPGPPVAAIEGLTVGEIDNLLSARGSRAWHEGYFAGQHEAERRMAESYRYHEDELRKRYVDGMDATLRKHAQRLTVEHLSASAPLADAIQKARKAFEAGQNAPNTTQRTKAREALGRALDECVSAYAKFTSGLSS